jgi:hypothetical protein
MASTVEERWYKWFYENSDFGPADGDVKFLMMKDFERETGLTLPDRFKDEV